MAGKNPGVFGHRQMAGGCCCRPNGRARVSHKFQGGGVRFVIHQGKPITFHENLFSPLG